MKQFVKNFYALRLVKSMRKKPATIEELERKHAAPTIVHYQDSLYFSGITEDGMSFVTRMSFRNRKLNENWLKIHIPGEGVWGFEDRGMIEGEGFEQGKLQYICDVPGKSWRILYQGQLFQEKKYYQVKLELKWESKLPIVDFSKDGLSKDQLAFHIAKQGWYCGIKKQLKALTRHHYEQTGSLKGSITWKRKKHQVNMLGFRSHTLGQNNWNDWDRHFRLTGELEDGRVIHAGAADYYFVEGLKSGYLFDGKKTQPLVTSPGFKELLFAERFNHTFSFYVQENKTEPPKKVTVEMLEYFPFEMDKVYSIRQAKSRITYDGVPGLGIVELGLKNPED